MNNISKVLLLITLLAYVISPVDFVPGPVDDLIMILVYALANGRTMAAANAGKEKYIESEVRDHKTDSLSS